MAENSSEVDKSDIAPLFLSSKTQEIFSVRMDEDVSTDSPYKLLIKEEILQDLKMRAAISDFHPVKQIVLDYPGTELLLVYDADFIHGQNFYLITSEEKKTFLLQPPGAPEEEGARDADTEMDEEEDLTFSYVPPVPKKWIPLGSEREINAEKVEESRPRLKYRYIRTHREFGAPVQFEDHDASNNKDTCIDCLPYEDKNFTVHRLQLDKSVQAVNVGEDIGNQTDWPYPKNAATQYEAQELDEETCEKLLASRGLAANVTQSLPRYDSFTEFNCLLFCLYFSVVFYLLFSLD